ncbi:MAG TPA: cupin domain-containing protein [Vicinamibacterales bacterium]|nr:cupin domain-containing protein [Vicinamibacterales bacterium]
MRINVAASVAGVAMIFGLAAVQASSSAQTPTGHVMVNPADMKWGPAPPGLPPGGQLAVMSGDPAKPGPFTIAVKFGDGYIVRPHWHPTAEDIIVVSGALLVGMGDTYTEASMKALEVGGFGSMPAKTNHFVKAKGATTLMISGMGPFEITYVDPKDDPRKK